MDPEIVLAGENENDPKPIVGIGLEPLGKLLVQLCIDPKRYEADRMLGQGHDLDPIPCASSQELAYKFRPEVQVQAKQGSLKVQRKSHVVPVTTGTGASEKIIGGERKGGTETAAPIDPEALLPGASNPQVVPYWRRCTKEAHLTEHFKPDAIVDLMKPASISEDRLGLLKRMRVIAATYLSLADRLSQTNPPAVGDEALAAVRAEQLRLRQLLGQVRTKLLGILSQDRQTLRDDDEILKLEPEQSFGLLEKQRERRRLEALLSKQS
ncbi:MAG: hypothetical protein U1A77_18800 [Pirellulales bacterium]